MKAVRMAGRAIGLYFFILKMYTAAVMAKPPAARATPENTSTATQSPQG